MLEAVRARKAGILAGYALVALAASAVYAHAVAFGSWDAFDDPGYLLVTLRQFFAGHPLYDGVLSHYGPAYYLANDLALRATGVAADHAAIRWLAVAEWVLAAAGVALAVHRWTGSYAVAAATHVAALRALAAMGEVPGHPTGFVNLLLALWVLLETGRLASPRRAYVRGAVLAAIALTKMNVGALLGVALVLEAEPSRLRAAFRCLVLPAALAVPFLLTRRHLADHGVRALAILVAVALATIAAHPERTPRTRGRALATCALGIAVTGAAVLGWVFARGTTPGGLVQGLVLRHLAFAETFTLPVTLTDRHVAWSLALAAPAAWLRLRGAERLAPAAEGALALAKVAVGVVVLGLAATRHLEDIVGLAVPALWLVLSAPRHDGTRAPLPAARSALAGAAALLALVAYPVKGSQFTTATLVLISLGALELADGLSWLRHRSGGAARSLGLARIAAAIVAATTLAFLLGTAVRARAATLARRPLVLPGCAGIRLPEGNAAVYEFLVHNLRTHSDRFATLPGLNSLHVLADRPPLTLAATTAWFSILTLDEERAQVNALASFPRACAVVSPALAGFWTHGRIPPDRPLVRVLRDEFVPAARVGIFSFQVRRGRRIEPTYAARVPAPWTGVVEVDLPALGPTRLGRAALVDATSEVVLADTAGPRPSMTLTSHGPRPDLSVPTQLRLEIRGPDPRSLGFPVVRLEGQDGEPLGSVPFPDALDPR